MNFMDSLHELLGFVGSYLALGAVGLRYGVLSSALGRRDAGEARASLLAVVGRRTAWLGIVGAVLSTGLLLIAISARMAARNLSAGTVLTANRAQGGIELALLALAVIGFLLALARIRAGWPLAAIGAVGASISNLVSLRWTSMVNPVHILAGSLWLGTLFGLMTIAVPAVVAGPQDRDEKARTVADLVNAFSPLALVAGGVLVLSGIVTAVRHLKFVAALWTTSYGMTLDVKLVVVAIVFALGAWNWRRVRPTLGTPAATDRLRTSARLELTVAGIVLLITSVLVTLPTPRLPK